MNHFLLRMFYRLIGANRNSVNGVTRLQLTVDSTQIGLAQFSVWFHPPALTGTNKVVTSHRSKQKLYHRETKRCCIQKCLKSQTVLLVPNSDLFASKEKIVAN